MMAASLSTGDERKQLSQEITALDASDAAVTEEEFQQQMQYTAAVFAMDMLLLKFIQGLPVVGVVGGAANPVYYRKIMKYVQLQYRKRYLEKQMRSMGDMSDFRNA